MKALCSILLGLCALTASAQELAHFTYTPTEANIPNPERGFCSQPAVGYWGTIGVGSYSSTDGRRLVRLLVYLGGFRTSDISASALDNLQKNFDNLRNAGMKCVLRFAYFHDDNNAADKLEATPEQTYRHLEQLTPVVRRNADVIALLESGIVGKWGEWHSNTYFTTAAEQQELIRRLLEMMPADRFVSMRTPAQARTALGLPDYTGYVTQATAFNGTPVSRLGGYNDGLLGSTGDLGTYSVGGDAARTFWEKQSLYAPMGGETGGKGDNTYDSCIQPAYAEARLSSQHYSYLNSEWYGPTLEAWKSNGFYATLQRKLGYRFVLQSADITAAPVAGQPLTVRVSVSNEGYAAPFNPRPVQLVIADESGTEKLRTDFDTDPRFWLPGQTQVIETTVDLPADLSAGNYSIDLDLPDAYASLKGRPEYAIRLANEDTWDATTGRNRLATVAIASEGPEADYTAQYLTDIKPWTEHTGELFYLKPELLAAYDLDALATYCPESAYNALKALVDNPQESMLFPEGYYRIRGNNNTYVAYPLATGLASNKKHLTAVGSGALSKDPSTVVKVSRNADGTFYLQTQGQYLCNTIVIDAGNYRTITTTPTKVQLVVHPSYIGKCAIWLRANYPASISDTPSTHDYLLANQTAWHATRNDAWFTFEPADQQEMTAALNPIGGEAYATFSADFPYEVTTAATEAYTLTVGREKAQGVYVAELHKVDGVVPAGEPVTLINPNGATTTTLRINTSTPPEAVAVNALEPSLLPLDWSAHSADFTLGKNSDEAGFYRWSGTTLEANKAYLPAAAVSAGTRALLLQADEATGIAQPTESHATGRPAFDLQGRRVSSLSAKGIYIRNGRRVLVP